VAQVVTINRPDVVALIERAAEKLTKGNKTEAVNLAMKRLLEREERVGSLLPSRPEPPSTGRPAHVRAVIKDGKPVDLAA
jgi:hypothetical protein